MDSREGLISGVTVIAPEAPSSYHMAPRTENSSQDPEAPPLVLSPASAGTSAALEKKKRGRPRKYGPDGAVGIGRVSPMPVSASGEFSVAKKKMKAHSNASEAKLKHKHKAENLGDLSGCSSGGSFTPHMVTVNPGEDVLMKIIAFSQQGPRAICILSAVGSVSNVKLLQTNSGGTLTYEGRFEILSLSGSITPTEIGGSRVDRSGGMSITLASPDGRVVGGVIGGLLIAAGPVQVVVGSFLPSSYIDTKPKKAKSGLKIMAPTMGSAIHHTSNMAQKMFDSNDQNNPERGNTNSAHASAIQTDNWGMMPTVQNARKSTTDINISFQGE